MILRRLVSRIGGIGAGNALPVAYRQNYVLAFLDFPGDRGEVPQCGQQIRSLWATILNLCFFCIWTPQALRLSRNESGPAAWRLQYRRIIPEIEELSFGKDHLQLRSSKLLPQETISCLAILAPSPVCGFKSAQLPVNVKLQGEVPLFPLSPSYEHRGRICGEFSAKCGLDAPATHRAILVYWRCSMGKWERRSERRR